MRLFGRQVQVELGTVNGAGKVFRDLRVVATATLSDASEPSKAVIRIYNVAEETVSLAQGDDTVVRLIVGYAVPLLVFQGNPTPGGVKITREGPTRVLEIEAQDGGTAYRTAYSSTAYNTATTAAQVFAQLADTLGLPLGTVEIDDAVEFPFGIVLNGPVRKQLDRVATMSRARWFIRDGALYVVSIGGSTGEPATVFSSKTGNLIGAPQATDDGIEIRGLLCATMRPGMAFRVESERYNGDYLASDVEFKIDTHGQDFYVDVKGTPLG